MLGSPFTHTHTHTHTHTDIYTHTNTHSCTNTHIICVQTNKCAAMTRSLTTSSLEALCSPSWPTSTCGPLMVRSNSGQWSDKECCLTDLIQTLWCVKQAVLASSKNCRGRFGPDILEFELRCAMTLLKHPPVFLNGGWHLFACHPLPALCLQDQCTLDSAT